MTADQETELLAKLERIAAALEAQNTASEATATIMARIAGALERDPANPPIVSVPPAIQAKGTK